MELQSIKHTRLQSGVIRIGDIPSFEFEEHYIELRKKEGRLPTDQQLKDRHLFDGWKTDTEWQLRMESAHAFDEYLTQKKAQDILEIGCGNGWFSYFLAKSGSRKVWASDINLQELEQGARCFDHPNLNFIQCEELELLPDHTFDIIVFNASIQYFEDVGILIDGLQPKLKDKGEIHILDSPFYQSIPEADAAKKRSKDYYVAQGFREMIKSYHHHTYWDLPTFKFHYRPGKLKKLLGGRKNPFPWIQIIC